MNKKHIVRIVAVTAALTALVGLSWLRHWANSPAVGNIENVPATTQTNQETKQPLDTPYFSALLPGQYQVTETTNNKATGLLQILANEQIKQGISIGITTAPLPTDGLAGIGDYVLRDRSSTSYKRVDIQGAPNDSVAFSTTEGSTNPNICLFLTHGGRYVSVAISGPSHTYDQLAEKLSQVITSWQWK
jgi:hypothetical protein